MALRKRQLKVKWSRYRPGVAQRVGRGIALLFHDHSTWRGWVVSSTPRPHFTPGKDPVPILQEAGWAPGSVWTGGKSRPHRDSIPDRPAPSQSLYRLNYPAHKEKTGYPQRKDRVPYIERGTTSSHFVGNAICLEGAQDPPLDRWQKEITDVGL